VAVAVSINLHVTHGIEQFEQAIEIDLGVLSGDESLNDQIGLANDSI
jgi:hypothetical protein